MKKYLFIIICFFLTNFNGYGQDHIFKTSKGSISFRSDAPLEIITASSYELEGVIDHASSTFAFVVPIYSFKGFNNGLQQQHFYENYLESSKYPEASFSGKIIEFIDLTNPGTYVARAKGRLTIHGRTQERIIKIEFISTGTEVNAKTQFMVPLTDHQIEVPRVVNQKIAQDIKVTVKATLILEGKS